MAAVVAAILVAVPIAAGVVISSGGTGAQTASAADSKLNGSRSPSHPRAGTGGKTAAQLGALVALLHHRTTMRVTPGGRPLARIGLRTQFGSPTTFLVVRQRDGWLGVTSPDAGNGRVGWVRSAAVSLTRIHFQLNVSLSRRRLTVLENGRAVQHYEVAVGRPDAPTPTGHFAVTDRLATHDPAGPYGCCILALSAESPHEIQGWSGGNRIAIHSTPDSGSIGLAVSHGCLRLSLADGRWLLRHIPLGTPTIIRA